MPEKSPSPRLTQVEWYVHLVDDRNRDAAVLRRREFPFARRLDGRLIELRNGRYHADVGHRAVTRDEQLQAQIKEKLRNEVAVREQKRFLSQLKQRATIEYSTGAP